MKGRAWLLAAPLFLAAGLSAEDFAVRTFSLDQVKRVRVRTDSGVVKVRGEDVAKARVSVLGDTRDCDITTEVKADELTLTAKGKKGSLWGTKDCRAGFEVEVPGSLALDAATGSGEIEVSDLKSGVDAGAGSGDIKLEGVAGPVALKTGSGRISGDAASERLDVKMGSGGLKLTGLLGSAFVKSGSGDVKLIWAKAPRQGEADVKAGSGDVTLEFPDNVKLEARVLTGSGSFNNELGSASGAEFRVAVKGGSSDVTIRKAREAQPQGDR